MRSFSDYVPNTATNGYIRMIQEFSDAVDRLLDRHGATAEQLEAVSYYADRYSQKLAATPTESPTRQIYTSKTRKTFRAGGAFAKAFCVMTFGVRD